MRPRNRRSPVAATPCASACVRFALLAIAACGCGRSSLLAPAEEQDEPFPMTGEPDSGTPEPRCGNGMRDPGEQCDGYDLGPFTCSSLGFATGVLRCDASCRYDTGACATAADRCGNGFVDALEYCDGPNLGLHPDTGALATCAAFGFIGTLRCNDRCTWDFSSCRLAPFCGNGAVDPGEACDGPAQPDARCEDFNLVGDLLCGPDCQWDLSRCEPPPECGNGVREASEACDGADLGGATCLDAGLGDTPLGNAPRCTLWCGLDFTTCNHPAACGDGVRAPGESCDRLDFGTACRDLGFAGGQLRCQDCSFDTSRCTTCGDGRIDPGEACEPSIPLAITCQELGQGQGALACDPNTCTLDRSGCALGENRCGNGLIEAGEECDLTTLPVGVSCVSLGYSRGEVRCNPETCRLVTAGCGRFPEPPDCTDCIADNCGDPLARCLADPSCSQGMTCLTRTCRDSRDPECASSCLLGSDASFDLFSCAASICGGRCLGYPDL